MSWPTRTTWCGSSARGLPRIVVRRFADGEEQVIAFDEEAYALGMSPGYEYDTDDPLHLFLADHAGAGLRLRHGDARARLRKQQEVPSGHDPRSMSRAASWRRPGRREVPVSLLYRKDDQARRTAPSCSTATAPTACPSPPASPPTRCSWSIAASSTPSPISAAARTRAIAGTRTASARRRRTPSPISSPPPNISRAKALPRGAASSPRAAAPAAC